MLYWVISLTDIWCVLARFFSSLSRFLLNSSNCFILSSLPFVSGFGRSISVSFGLNFAGISRCPRNSLPGSSPFSGGFAFLVLMMPENSGAIISTSSTLWTIGSISVSGSTSMVEWAGTDIVSPLDNTCGICLVTVSLLLSTSSWYSLAPDP